MVVADTDTVLYLLNLLTQPNITLGPCLSFTPLPFSTTIGIFFFFNDGFSTWSTRTRPHFRTRNPHSHPNPRPNIDNNSPRPTSPFTITINHHGRLSQPQRLCSQTATTDRSQDQSYHSQATISANCKSSVSLYLSLPITTFFFRFHFLVGCTSSYRSRLREYLHRLDPPNLSYPLMAMTICDSLTIALF